MHLYTNWCATCNNTGCMRCKPYTRERWSRTSLAGIRRVYTALLRKGRNPTKPSWDEAERAFFVWAGGSDNNT